MRMRIWVSKTTLLSKQGLFQWVGMEDMVSKILKKNTGPCEKKPPLFNTLGGHGGRLMPYSYCAVRLCLLRPLRMRIWAKFARTSREFGPNSRTGMHIFTITEQVVFAMNRPNVLCSLFAASETLTKGIYIVEVMKGPLAGPPSQLLYGHRTLPTHGPLCDVPPLRTEAVVYGVVVNDNLHT